MRIAYLDESGTPELAGGTSHFVLLAVAIDGQTWRTKDDQLEGIKARFGLEQAEVHAGWMARAYPEQDHIPGFAGMDWATRRAHVKAARDATLLKRATLRGVSSVQEMRKNFRKTEGFVHLTLAERRAALEAIATAVSAWDDCAIFAECADKRVFTTQSPTIPLFEEAFQQVVTRLHRHLELRTPRSHGLLVQDHNETVAKRLTDLMRRFHRSGTRWIPSIHLLVETPLFVDSRLTSMVQVADLAAYAVRRYLEKRETRLFDLVATRFDSKNGRWVGVRHYRGARTCDCRICTMHQ